MVKDHSDNEKEIPLLLLNGLRFLMNGPFDGQDRTYHSLCYTSCGAQAGKRNDSMSPSRGIDLTSHRITSGCSSMALRGLL